MVHAGNHCSASNSLSIHIHRTMIVTLITLVLVWWGHQENSPQWLMGYAGHWSILHDVVPSLAILGPF